MAIRAELMQRAHGASFTAQHRHYDRHALTRHASRAAVIPQALLAQEAGSDDGWPSAHDLSRTPLLHPPAFILPSSQDRVAHPDPDSQANLAVQRDDFPALTPPSLLRPRDAAPTPRLDSSLRLEMGHSSASSLSDVRTRAAILERFRRLLDPAHLATALVPQLSPSNWALPSWPPPRERPRELLEPAPFPAAPFRPALPDGGLRTESATIAPEPGGKVAEALLADPQIAAFVSAQRDRVLNGLLGSIGSPSTAGWFGIVAGLSAFSASVIVPLLAFDGPRVALLERAPNLMLQMSQLPGYALQVRVRPDDVTVGVHIDIGRLLPALLNFGTGDFSPLPLPPLSPQVSREADGGAPLETNWATFASLLTRSRGIGSALPGPALERFEAATNADLSMVRVHADGEADLLARAASARAFTSGRDIYFRSGAYAPESSEGARLLAHELTHVLQQAKGPVGGRNVGAQVRMSEPNDPHEQEAEHIAEAMFSGTEPQIMESP